MITKFPKKRIFRKFWKFFASEFFLQFIFFQINLWYNLQALSMHPDSWFDSNIHFSEWDLLIEAHLQKQSLLSFSWFYGWIACFKFIFLNYHSSLKTGIILKIFPIQLLFKLYQWKRLPFSWKPSHGWNLSHLIQEIWAGDATFSCIDNPTIENSKDENPDDANSRRQILNNFANRGKTIIFKEVIF
jgi:hypothetical protein